MNIFEIYKQKFIKVLKDKNVELFDLEDKFLVEKPKLEKFGDLTFNIAMILSTKVKNNPYDIACQIEEVLKKNFKEFDQFNVIKPGFINFKFKKDFWSGFLSSLGDNYGVPNLKRNKILLEFVSANPTGPLHVGHCRGAVYGDTLANLLKFAGHTVVKEYYVNDYGNQIDIFAKSVYHRIKEILHKTTFPENKNLYPGQYIKEIARDIIKEKKISNYDNFEKIKDLLSKESILHAMKLIKSNLESMGIKHDNFVYESNLVKQKIIEKVVTKLTKENLLYDGFLPKPKSIKDENWIKRKQLLFKSSSFGDDEDRALQKPDGSWTYFANDIAYHLNKIERSFDKYINILGADHAGYIKRITSSVVALQNNIDFKCKVTQLVKLYKSGKPYKMSKRAGDFIEVKDLISSVGSDAVRFMMVYRNTDSQIDFDFDIVTDRSKDNPVFYVQYASARIHSIFRKLNKNIEDDIKSTNLNLLNDKSEIDIIKKISEWPKVISLSVKNLEPHRVPYYLYELSSLFHFYWNLGKSDDKLRILENNNKDLVAARLFLIKKIFFVIKSGLNILNVSIVKEM